MRTGESIEREGVKARRFSRINVILSKGINPEGLVNGYREFVLLGSRKKEVDPRGSQRIFVILLFVFCEKKRNPFYFESKKTNA